MPNSDKVMGWTRAEWRAAALAVELGELLLRYTIRRLHEGFQRADLARQIARWEDDGGRCA